MRRSKEPIRIASALVGMFVLVVSSSASADLLGFQGSLAIQMRNTVFPPLVVSSTGTALVSDDGSLHLVSLVVPVGAFGPTTVVLPDTGWPVTGISSIRLTLSQNLTGTFSGISAGPSGGGTMGLAGLAKICLSFAPACANSISFPLTPSIGGAGFGIGGTRTATGSVSVTMRDAPWTVGQPTMTIHTAESSATAPVLPAGFVHGPASLTSSTAQPSGAVQLVTVTKVFTSLTGAFPELPITGVLTLHFVPEPGTLVMLATGVASLALYGRRQRRR